METAAAYFFYCLVNKILRLRHSTSVPPLVPEIHMCLYSVDSEARSLSLLVFPVLSGWCSYLSVTDSLSLRFDLGAQGGGAGDGGATAAAVRRLRGATGRLRGGGRQTGVRVEAEGKTNIKSRVSHKLKLNNRRTISVQSETVSAALVEFDGVKV